MGTVLVIVPDTDPLGAVLEVYQKWCGPTRAVVSTFKRYLLENPDAPVRFFTCCNETVQDLAKYDKCEPSFLFIRVRAVH